MTDRRTHDGPSLGPSQYPQHPTVHFSPSVHQRTHATDCRSHDGPSCTIVLVVRDPVPKGLSLFLSVLLRTTMTDRHSHDGPSYTTVLIVRDPVPKGLSLFLSVLLRTHAIDCDSHDAPSCITVMTVRDPSLKGLHTFSKCPLTDNYDGPSYPRRSVRHNCYDCQRPLS